MNPSKQNQLGLFEAAVATAAASKPAAQGAGHKLVRRKPSMMALEQRFMFDGAAVGDVVSEASKTVLDKNVNDGLLRFAAPESALPAAVVTAQAEAEKLVADFLARPDAKQQLFALFNGGQTGEPSAQWLAAFDQLMASTRNGDFSVRVELRTSAELQGALGAYSDQGTMGQATVYLNAEYARSSSASAIQSVLIEELGHAIDSQVNGGVDSPGDEGHAFASWLLHGVANAVAAGIENDQLTLNIDGQAVSAEAAAPYNVAQTTYVPLPEPDVQTALKAIAGATKVSGNIETVIAISATGDGTVVVYDHWEDGYEADINNPTQASTAIWGDGNTANDGGYTTGLTGDVFNAGQTILLRNAVNPASPITVDYDARDKIGSTKAVAITKAGWSVTPGTVLSGAVAVIDAGNAGKVYTLPVGQNVETVATGSNKLFEYTSAHIIATQNGTNITVDKDGNGTTDLTFTLNEGETYLVNGGLNAGGKITADKGIGVYLIAGDVDSAYENRWFALTPDEQWSSSYYAPVSTTLAADPAYVVLYNPNASAITVNWDTATGAQTAISIAAKSTGYALMPASAAHFYTSSGAKFYAVGLIDADATSNATHDWSYSLVPETYLTTKFVVAWGPGNNNAPVTGAANGSPVWVTTTANTSIFVDSSTVTVKDSKGTVLVGDQVGNTTTYEYSVKALESYRLFDSDNDQSGLTVYTIDGTLITAAWGEDPSIAGAGNPYLDMGTTVLPFPDYVFTKDSTEAKTITYGTGVSNDNGQVELSEEIEYTINLTNRAVIDLYNINIKDAINPTDGAAYVAGSTHLKVIRADGTTLINQAIADDTLGDPFPLAKLEGGYTIADIDFNGTNGVDGLKRGDRIVITYRVKVRDDINASLANAGFTITNDAEMSGNPQGSNTSIDPKRATNKTIISATGTYDGQVFFKDAGFLGAKANFSESDALGIEVTDTDADLDASVQDTLTVTVTNTTTGETEQITLTETDISSGTFRATLATSPTAGVINDSGSLQLRKGDSIRADYTDPVFGAAFDNPTNRGVAGDTDNDIATGNPNIAYAGVSVPSQIKTLYFSDDSANNLDRIQPNDGSPASTALINASAASTAVTYSDDFSSGDYGGKATGSSNWAGDWTEEGDDADSGNGTVRNSSSQLYLRDAHNKGISRQFSALGSAGILTFDIRDTSQNRQFEDGDKISVYEYKQVSSTWTWVLVQDITGAEISTTAAIKTIALSQGAAGIKFLSVRADTSDSDRVYIDNVKIISGYVATKNTSGSADYPISAAAPAGQTFSFSGSSTAADAISINSLTLSLKKTGTTSATATVSVRNAWDGTVLWSGTVSTGQLTTGYQDIALNVSGLTLDKSATYVLRVDSNNSGIVWQGGTTDTYATGNRLSNTGNSASGDMRFAVSGQESLLSSVTFTQGLSMATDFTVPAGGAIKVITHVTNITGLADGQAITATLSANGTTFATATNPDYDATSGTLTWNFSPLGSAKTISAGQSLKLVIQNNQAGTSFKIAYDSTDEPSRIELPTTTVIDIVDADPVTSGVQEIGFFDKSFINGGSPIADAVIDAGGLVYIRVKVADPFGDYDVSTLDLNIDDGTGGATPITLSLNDSYVVDVAGDGRAYKTYEYAWQTNYNIGNYDISVTANEGTEGTVRDVAAQTFRVQERDLGTPSTTMFLTNLSAVGGIEAGSVYPSATNRAYLRVTDLDESGHGTVTVTVNGYTVTLTETATPGIFEADLGSAAVHAGDATAKSNAAAYFTNMPNGSTLAANYADPSDAADVSSDSIVINRAPDAVNNSQSIKADQQATGNVLSDSDGIDTDPDGQTLSVTAVNGSGANLGDTITLPSGARLLVKADGSYIYDPSTLTSPPTSGTPVNESFTYTISDGKGGTDTATVNITVSYVNPIVIDNQADTDGATVELDVSNKFSAINSIATVEYTATGLPNGLSIDINTGIISGSIASGASTLTGNKSFSVTVTGKDVDGAVADVIRTFTWTVTNVAPAAVDDTNSTSVGVPVTGNMVANDSDGTPDGDVLTVSKVNGSNYTLNASIATTHGIVKITNANGAYTYTPTTGYTGEDSFSYTISDGNGGTSTATVTIHVIGVTDVTVNEASPWAVFAVNGAGGGAITLALANSTATMDVNGIPVTDGSEDFGPLLEYSADNGTTWNIYTTGSVNLNGSGNLLVRTPIINDGPFEGAHTFTLTATVFGGASDSGTGTIKDDGTGDIYDDNGNVDGSAPKDDDRPTLTVTGMDVEEGSRATFTVTLTNAIEADTAIDLALADVDTETGDFSTTYEWSEDGGTTWNTVSSNQITLTGGKTSFLVRVATTDDTSFEGAEAFKLTASFNASALKFVNGSSGTTRTGYTAEGSSTIYDDGSIDGDDGSDSDTSTVKDDDRGITVSGLDDVSEGSNAIFKVDLPDGNDRDTEISLVLGNGTAGSNDYGPGFTAYYYNGITQVPLSIIDGKINLPAGVTSFFVSVPITQDPEFEGAENFSLTATITGGNSADDTSTILDDGTGKTYDDKGLNPTGPGNDDRPKPAPIPPVISDPEAPPKPFVPEGEFVPPPPAKFYVPEPVPVKEVLTSSSGFRAAVIEGSAPALTLFKGIDDQFVESVGNVTSFALPSDAFAHTRAEATLTLEAKMADGSRLPDWVLFDGQAGVFRLTPPAGYTGELEVKVIARDNEGREAEAKFKLNVAPKVMKVGRESLSEKLKLAGRKGNQWLPSHELRAERAERMAPHRVGLAERVVVKAKA